MGEMADEEIIIDKFDAYYGTSDKPADEDIIVAILVNDHQIDDSWIFKCTSEDSKKLKLVSERHDMVKRYEKYINDREYFKAQQKLNEVNAINDKNKYLNTNKILNTNSTTRDTLEDKGSNLSLIISCSLLFITLIIFILLKRIRNKE